MATRKTPRRTKKADNKRSAAGKKLIAVVGATGAQGGGLVRAILNDKNGPFTARAIHEKLKLGEGKSPGGCRRRSGGRDLDDVKSLKKHSKALTALSASPISGAPQAGEGDFPGPQHGRGGKGSRRQTRHLVDAGRHTQIDSALDDRMPTLMGKYKVPHFDGKGEADDIFTKLGVPRPFS